MKSFYLSRMSSNIITIFEDMMKKIILFSTIFSLSACQSTTITSVNPLHQSHQQEKIVIQSNPCYGTCPVYEIEISTNGQGRYMGKQNTIVMGERPFQIDSITYQKIADELDTLKPAWGVVADNQDCQPLATDHTTYRITWYQQQQQASYIHDSGCHSQKGLQITSYLYYIPRLVGIEAWVRKEYLK